MTKYNSTDHMRPRVASTKMGGGSKVMKPGMMGGKNPKPGNKKMLMMRKGAGNKVMNQHKSMASGGAY